MIISEQWLRDWVQVDLGVQELADCLTNAGLEVDGVQSLGGVIEGLVIGRVLEVSKHPDADRLQLTKVDVGEQVLDIVCGAHNVRVDLLVAVATAGTKLPNGLKIKRAKVRGIESNGMLCSASELGLEEQSAGILELDQDAIVGARVDSYLQLDDALIDIDLTPNRGDCLSVQGIARELKFLANGELRPQNLTEVEPTATASISVDVQQPAACPTYLGRVITGINARATTPFWLAERLRRSGVRPISPVVDITNYVMLELGQPLHAFDHAKLNGGIVVRPSVAGEKITLLDDSEAVLDGDTLVIADQQVPVAIAGVMGGAASAIGDETQDIVLEAAHFTRKSAAGRARRYGLHTESSHRFERGVDPLLPAPAIQRATQLVLEICGGEAGPVCAAIASEAAKARAAVELRFARLQTLLGMQLERAEVSRILLRIADSVQDTTTGWLVTPPSYRFDIEFEADLVEEVARVKGYNNIPTAIPRIAPRSMVASEALVSDRQVRQTLVARDFHEAITYSFVEPSELAKFSTETPVKLTNPLAENMSVMRSSLLPGLLSAAQFNRNRQRSRLRLFEIGASYHHASEAHSGANAGFKEITRLAGVVSGPRYEPQWGVSDNSAVDFYDVKADLEAVLSLTGKKEAFIFNDFEHISLHPGQVCQVCCGDSELGFLGRLHPTLEKHYGFDAQVFVFEIDLLAAMQAKVPEFAGVSKFPSVKRDLSVLVAQDLPVAALLENLKLTLGSALSTVTVFDVYRGAGVADSLKSVSLSLVLQNQARTFTDQESEDLVAQALSALQANFSAQLRS